jgi:GNAT superfamily N-acetyltransferase
VSYTVHPLTPDRWGDLEALFGPTRGAISGCWCMWFRLTRGEWAELGRDGRKRAFKRLVTKGPPPGLLAYDVAGRAIGWCAIAPREATPRIAVSRVAKPVDDRPAWAITCFYIDRGFRRQGVMAALIAAATRHAGAAGATLVEAYPMETVKGDAWGAAFVGVAGAFRAAGFTEAARRTPNRPLLRKAIARVGQ